MTDVVINSPPQIGQVIAFGGSGVFENFTIDLSTQPPIVDLDNWVTVLESQDYPESFWNLADVNIVTDVANDGKFVKYDFVTDKMILDSVNNFPETVDDSLNYVWFWTIGETNGQWWKLSETDEIINLQTDINTLTLDELLDVNLTVPPVVNNVLKYDGTEWIAGNSIEEPPNNNIGHLWWTTAGTSSWIALTSDGEYSATKSKVLANEGNIAVLQSEQITQNTDITNLQNQVNALVLDDLQDVDLTVVPTNGQVLAYDDGISQWIASSLPPSNNTLNTLNDVVLGSLNNNDLLTYDQVSDKWINKVKPDYTIEEMTDFDNTVAKLDNDFLSYNLSKSKWEPKTFEQENPNYITLWQLNNTLIPTQTVGLIWTPIFNQANINQTLIGDFVGIITNYSIWFTRQCVVEFNYNFTSNNNNFNAFLTLNSDVNVFF